MSAADETSAMAKEPTGGRPYRLLRMLAAVGRFPGYLLRPPAELSSLIVAVIRQGCRPANWRRTLADEFVRQCKLTGVDALPFIIVTGVLIGLAMVFQALYWLNILGQSGSVGKILVLVLVREVAPLMVALIVIGRSGSVNMVELSHLSTSGQLHMLDAQGIDPFLFYIVPRCWATALATFCLNIIFIMVALAAGYTVGTAMGSTDITIIEFINNVLAAMGLEEYALIALKPLATGLLIALITCMTGLSAGGTAGRMAAVLPSGFVKSVLAVFLVSGTLTVLF